MAFRVLQLRDQSNEPDVIRAIIAALVFVAFGAAAVSAGQAPSSSPEITSPSAESPPIATLMVELMSPGLRP